MKNTLIIVPTEREAAYFTDHGLQAHICGVGMAECAATTAQLLAHHKPALALLAGIAGTHNDRLTIGDTVAITSETIADLGRSERRQRLHSPGPEQYEVFVPLFQKTYRATHIPSGLPTAHGHTVNTAGRNADGGPAEASSKTDSDELWVENMEGAAFLAVCEKFGTPAAEIRTISNRTPDPVTPENLDLAARHLAAALKNLLP